jgi:hypothetical protein
MATETLDWKDLLTFLSPTGQQQIVDFVAEAKATRGSNWLPEIQREFPMFSWIVELVCTRTADEAFADLQDAFPNYPLWLARGQLTALHGRLKHEIEKPRG